MTQRTNACVATLNRDIQRNTCAVFKLQDVIVGLTKLEAVFPDTQESLLVSAKEKGSSAVLL